MTEELNWMFKKSIISVEHATSNHPVSAESSAYYETYTCVRILKDRVKESRIKRVRVAGADVTALRRKTVSWSYGFPRFDRAAQDMILLASAF